MTSLPDCDAITLAGLLRRREVSAREVIDAHIERTEACNGQVNAIVTTTYEAARARAATADEALARSEPPGLLHGLPVAHKDLHDTAGVRTTYGSPLFADHVPDTDDIVVERMAAAGAISLGKTNVPEFGRWLAHRQPRVRRHPQPVGPDPQRRRQQRRSSRRPRRADGLPGRRQRPRRLPAQPGQLLRRRRPAPVARPGPGLAVRRGGRRARRERPDGPHGG